MDRSLIIFIVGVGINLKQNVWGQYALFLLKLKVLSIDSISNPLISRRNTYLNQDQKYSVITKYFTIC